MMKSLTWSIANRAGIVASVLAVGWMATDLYAKHWSVEFVWITVLWGVLWIIEAITGRDIENKAPTRKMRVPRSPARFRPSKGTAKTCQTR